MAAPSLSIRTSQLPKPLLDELSATIRGPVSLRSQPEFAERTRTFNGKLITPSLVVVSPADAQDVSAVVLFCKKHTLSLSVRAGGYGIAGFSVAGDIVIDLSLLREVSLDAPLSVAEGEKDYSSLVEQPSSLRVKAASSSAPADRASATEQAPSTSVSSTKRPRNDGAESPTDTTDHKRNRLNTYDAASPAIAQFLAGPPLPDEEGGEEQRFRPIDQRTGRQQPPTSYPPVDHRLGTSVDRAISLPVLDTRQLSNTSSSSEDTVRSSVRSLSTSTGMTSPDEQPDKPDADPFGYVTAPAPVEHPPTYGVSSATSTLSGVVSSSTFAWRSPFVAGPSGSVLSGLPQGLAPGLAFTAGSPFAPHSLSGLALRARPIHSHAYLTFGAGMRQKELDMFSAEHPLEGISATGTREERVVPYHMPSSAHPVGSSIMILGGFGFLSRMYGLSSDNVVEIEMVLADGRIVVANKEGDPDLWWAVRGAGPAFGIATRYKVRAYPVPVVFAGNLVYRFHRATAPSLIKHFRDCIKGAPRELYANVLLTAGPADKDSLVVIQMCYVGPKERGQEYLQAISAWDGERCLLNEVREKVFLDQQDSVAQVLRGRPGRQWFLRSSLITSLPDEVINRTVIQFANTPIGCAWIFELSGGAIADFEDTCIPKEQREATWTVAALHQWDMGIDDPRCITSAEDWIDGTIKTVALGGPYPSFLARHEPTGRVKGAYGKNFDRLAEVKRRYDPENVFRSNFWPLDKDGEPIEAASVEPRSPTVEEMDLMAP